MLWGTNMKDVDEELREDGEHGVCGNVGYKALEIL